MCTFKLNSPKITGTMECPTNGEKTALLDSISTSSHVKGFRKWIKISLF